MAWIGCYNVGFFFFFRRWFCRFLIALMALDQCRKVASGTAFKSSPFFF